MSFVFHKTHTIHSRNVIPNTNNLMKNYLFYSLIIGLLISCSDYTSKNKKVITGTDILYQKAISDSDYSIFFYSKKEFKYSGFYLPKELIFINQNFKLTEKNIIPEEALSKFLDRKESTNIDYFNLLNKSNLTNIAQNKELPLIERMKLLYTILVTSEINYFQFNTYNNNTYIIKREGEIEEPNTLNIFGYDTTAKNTLIYYGNPKKEFNRLKINFDTLQINTLFKNTPVKSEHPCIVLDELRTKTNNAKNGIVFIRDFRESYYSDKMIFYASTFKI
jgi:hypothetical protein